MKWTNDKKLPSGPLSAPQGYEMPCARQTPGARKGICRNIACAPPMVHVCTPEVSQGPQWVEAQSMVLPIPSQRPGAHLQQGMLNV